MHVMKIIKIKAMKDMQGGAMVDAFSEIAVETSNYPGQGPERNLHV